MSPQTEKRGVPQISELFGKKEESKVLPVTDIIDIADRHNTSIDTVVLAVPGDKGSFYVSAVELQAENVPAFKRSLLEAQAKHETAYVRFVIRREDPSPENPDGVTITASPATQEEIDAETKAKQPAKK